MELHSQFFSICASLETIIIEKNRKKQNVEESRFLLVLIVYGMFLQFYDQLIHRVENNNSLLALRFPMDTLVFSAVILIKGTVEISQICSICFKTHKTILSFTYLQIIHF